MIPVEPAKPRLAVQAFWLIAAKTLAFIITLALPIVMVRLFNAHEFGVYKLVQVVNGSVTSLLGFGVGLSAFYFLPRLTDPDRKALIFNIVFYNSLMSCLAAALILCWAGIPGLAGGNETLAGLAPLLSALIAASLFASFCETVATANQDVLHSTCFIVGAQLTRAALILAAAAVFRSVGAVLCAWIIQAALQSIALVVYLQHRFPQFWRYRSMRVTREQIRYVAPLGLTSVLTIIQLDSHNYLVAHYFDAAQFALYAVGASQIPLVGILRESVTAVTQSRMSKLQHEGEKGRMLQLMLRSWRLFGMAFIPTCVGLFILSEPFIAALYTTAYTGSVPLFRLNLSLLLLSIFMTDSVARSFSEHRYWLLRNRILIVAVQLLLSFLLLRYTGMIGALAGLVLANVLDRALNVRLVFQTLGFERKHLYIFRQLGAMTLLALVAGVAPAAVIMLLSNWPPALQLATGVASYAICYCGLLIATGFLNAEEREYLARLAAPVRRCLLLLTPRVARVLVARVLRLRDAGAR